MLQLDFYAELLVEVLGKMLGRVDGAVLASRAAEAEHEVGEATFDVSGAMSVGQTIDAIEEGKDFAVVLKEFDDGSVKACEFLVRLVAPGIVRRAAVKDVASAIAACVGRDAFLVAKAEDAHHEGLLRFLIIRVLHISHVLYERVRDCWGREFG